MTGRDSHPVFASPIKSRPQYTGLSADPNARRHLIAAEGEGAAAVLELLGEAPAGFAARAEILFFTVTPLTSCRHRPRIAEFGPDRFETFATIEAVLAALDARLAAAKMGTRLYAAGTEGFVGRVIRLAIDHGVDHRSVVTEHRGSLARRVQCVHCKSFTEDVTTSVFECGPCGNLLFVRDHFSRRLAAFQGVCVNAEDRSVRPPAEEIYA